MLPELHELDPGFFRLDLLPFPSGGVHYLRTGRHRPHVVDVALQPRITGDLSCLNFNILCVVSRMPCHGVPCHGVRHFVKIIASTDFWVPFGPEVSFSSEVLSFSGNHSEITQKFGLILTRVWKRS